MNVGHYSKTTGPTFGVNYVAAGDFTSATDLASAIQSGIITNPNFTDIIHADLDPDGSGNNTIINIRGTKKTNEIAYLTKDGRVVKIVMESYISPHLLEVFALRKNAFLKLQKK